MFSIADSKCDLTFSNETFFVKPGREDFPFAAATWYGAVAYGNYRSEIEGLEPCVDFADWSCRLTNTGFRLPTEVEWEKAARGQWWNSQYPWYSPGGSWAPHIEGSKANYLNSGDPYEAGTSPLGYYDGNQSPGGVDMANGYGLYDMGGNVYEWCWDWYQYNWYSEAASKESDTPGPLNGTVRVLRGGSWMTVPKALRNSARAYDDPSGVNYSTYGFRCVRSLYQLQQDYEAYFTAHPDVADATLGSYGSFEVMQRSQFWACLDELERTGEIQMDPPVQLINCPSNTAVIHLNTAERERCIAAHHAHAVWLDKNGLLPWSLDDYGTNDLARLFSDEAVFNNNFQVAAYVTVVDHSPSEAYGYLVDRGLIGSDRLSTTCLVLDDLRANFRHVNNSDPWEHRRPITLLETLTNTFDDVNYNHPVRISRTGCHSMARVTLALLRVLNIPGELVSDGTWYGDVHSSAVWPYIERVMPHGDDIYTTTQSAVPCDEFLVPFQFYDDNMGLLPCGTSKECMSYRYRVLKDMAYPSQQTSFHVCNATWWGYADGEDYLRQNYGAYLTEAELTNMVSIFEATCN